MSAKELVYDAVLRRATDIHLEPTSEQLSVRYRIDGILHAAEPFDRPTGDAVINVFKVLAALDISEKRKPQDGSFGAKLEGRELEFRVATSGSKSGEKLVMRILDNAAGVSKLDDSGLRPKLVQEIRDLVTQPHGMFLCCGPTGSGKTTTLYACLREIDRFQKNIITVEDPIEYHLDNITQMEINTKSGQTFAGSLRSILRQDPDVIMIGEIRDQETATIACQAATTGHMVFSTVHANDTVTALFRLLDLGVEPFMIASALTAVLGQRLVRVLCESVQGAVQAQARVPQEGQPARRQGRRLLPPADRAPAGLPPVRRHRLPRPDRDLRAAGHHRADARHDPREPLDQRDQGRGPQERHDLPPGGRPPPGHPGQDVDRRAAPGRQVASAQSRAGNVRPARTKRDQAMEIVVNLLICLLHPGMTYALMSEGLWGAR